MTVNASARNYRIWICKPGEDESTGLEVTAACVGDGEYFSVTDEPIDDGLLRTSGRLVLGVPYGQEEIYDPWENEEQWAIGNQILVQVADESGELRWHPRSGLYVLSHPEPAYPGSEQLTLEIGDRLSLLSYRQPHSEASGIEFGTGKSRTAIAAALLAKVGLELEGSIPGSLNYPLPKIEGSWIGQAGAMAIAGASILWQDREGIIQAKAIQLPPRSRLFKHVVGRDDAGNFQPIQGSERPCSVVRVVGKGVELIEPDLLTDKRTQEYAAREAVKEGGGDNNVLVATRHEFSYWLGNLFIRTITERRARGMAVQADIYEAFARAQGLTNYTAPDPFQLISSYSLKEIQVFESSREGRLAYIRTIAHMAEGAVFADFWKRNPPPKGSLITAAILDRSVRSEDGLVVYSYDNSEDSANFRREGGDSAGQVRRIKLRRREPLGAIAGAANNWKANAFDGGNTRFRRDLVTSEINLQTWSKSGEDEWQHFERIQQSGRVRSGTIAAFRSLATIKNERTISRGGNAQPPTAERRIPKFERREVDYRGKAEFISPAGSRFSPREQPLIFDYLTSKAEANKLAEIFGTIRHGRHRGFRIISALRDEWFDYEPHCRIDVAWNGYVYVGVTDLVTWTLAGNEAIVLAECIRVARVPGPKGTPDSYDSIPLDEPQPLQPIVQVLKEAEFEAVNEFEWISLPIKLNEVLPEKTATYEAINEISFLRGFEFEAVNEITITLPPILNAEAINEIDIDQVEVEDPSLILISHWPLEDTSWADSVGDNDLLPFEDFGGSVFVVAGAIGNGAGFDFSYLYSDSAELATGNVHWKLRFKLNPVAIASLLTVAQRETEDGAEAEWRLERFGSDQLLFKVFGAGVDQNVISPVHLVDDGWLDVAIEVNPTTSTLSLKVGTNTTTETLTITPVAIAGVGRFRIGNTYCLVDEIRFYKEI